MVIGDVCVVPIQNGESYQKQFPCPAAISFPCTAAIFLCTVINAEEQIGVRVSFCVFVLLAMPGGSLKKTCPNCGQKIYNGCKVCNLCKAPQPQKVRQKKKLEKFQNKASDWCASVTKNNLKSHIIDDDTAILLEKLHTLGLKPLLLIAKQKSTSVMMPQKVQLSTGAKTCLQNIEEIFALMLEGEIVQHVLYYMTPFTVSHKSDYTPRILANISLYLFTGQL
ncbi:hypothetical protein N1851_009916 [Merluccius polli]|uniref:Uncharacterized protein n=1 Tax=Merluccius polli TaxID=89951 RepID=A0AA47MZ37_MERPO|nr:hypothetical protein N1851_009916 [Merluccius polli]